MAVSLLFVMSIMSIIVVVQLWFDGPLERGLTWMLPSLFIVSSFLLVIGGEDGDE